MNQVAQRYARALFELAQTQGVVPEISRNILQLDALLKAEPSISAFLKNKLTRQEDAVTALALISAQLHFGQVTQNFLQVLIFNRRLGIVSQVIAAFRTLQEQSEGVMQGEVITASPLTAEIKAGFEKTLSQKTGRQVLLSEQRDDSLLGGVVIKLGSHMIDASVRTQLNRIQDVLKG